jgi:uncharacterized protein (DUF433 family)
MTGMSSFHIPHLILQFLGRYIVADPDICHGKPTFRETRILVADVLDQVAAGLAWETIIEEWRGSITQEAIKAHPAILARCGFLSRVQRNVWLEHPERTIW